MPSSSYRPSPPNFSRPVHAVVSEWVASHRCMLRDTINTHIKNFSTNWNMDYWLHQSNCHSLENTCFQVYHSVAMCSYVPHSPGSAPRRLWRNFSDGYNRRTMRPTRGEDPRTIRRAPGSARDRITTIHSGAIATQARDIKNQHC